MRRSIFSVFTFAAATATASELQSQTKTGTFNHACDVLSVAEIREITGRQDYPDQTFGDDPGEGAGGGSSCNYGGQKVFGPPDFPPRIGVVLVPHKAEYKSRFFDYQSRGPTRAPCKNRPATGVGEAAFWGCAPYPEREAYLFIKAGPSYDLVITSEVTKGTTLQAAEQAALAVGKAAAAKLR